MNSADLPENSPSSNDAHERAVDMLLADRAMVSQMLREHQVFRQVIEHSPAAYCVYDADDKLIVWSAAFERMHAPLFAEHGARIASGEARYPEMIRYHIEANYPAEQIEEQVAAHITAHRAANSIPSERDYGPHGIFHVSKYPTPSGAVVGNATNIDEVKARETALIAAREKAETAERAKAEFLANMSHEIRTPMNGILGMVELLGTSDLDRKQRLYTDVIARSGDALITVINDILDLSKIETGKLLLQPTSFDLAENMEDTALLFAASASGKQLDLILRVDPTLPRRMIGDAGRLRQIVSNLLSNAIKFTDTGHVFLDIGGRLYLRDDGREAAQLVIVVQDTGCGMSEDVLDRAFEKFTQGDASATRLYEGTGLGLSIAAGLVEAMGGRVKASSVEGEGATMTVTVEMPVDASRRILCAKDRFHGKRIVAVDATKARRTILVEQLTAWGFEAVGCDGPSEGVALLDQMKEHGTPADLVILGGLVATASDGTSLLDAAQAQTDPRPPVIVLEGIDRIVTAEDVDPRVFATLPCPGRSSQLLETLERAMTARPAVASPPMVAVWPDNGRAGTGMEADEPEACDVIADEPRPADEPALSALPDPVPSDTALPDSALSDTVSPDPEGSIDILVAEDNEINQFLIEQILDKTGYSYHLVANGLEAVEAWRTRSPRIVLMDISMPCMSGDEAAIAIRKAEEGTGQHVPIIAVTAHALRGDRDLCIGAGMDDYLPKPMKSVDVRAMIERWIAPDTKRLAG